MSTLSTTCCEAAGGVCPDAGKAQMAKTTATIPSTREIYIKNELSERKFNEVRSTCAARCHRDQEGEEPIKTALTRRILLGFKIRAHPDRKSTRLNSSHVSE